MTTRPKRQQLSTQQLARGIRDGDRAILGRAVTLIESTNPAHQQQSRELLQQILPHTGNAIRIGISGVPGVGKSTFIEAFGENLTRDKKHVAVLAVDPSSERTGGSILGDKTRMQNLSVNPNAFVRPSPTSGTLGGVNRVTRETMMLCEAADFDVVIVETVGVGQSETTVAKMVDFFLVLMLPGAGDDLQGIKRGVMEVADMIVVNKADGDNINKANAAKNDYSHAMRMLSPRGTDWHPPVLTCSGLNNSGLSDIWQQIRKHQTITMKNGAFEKKRDQQLLHWLHATINNQLLGDFHANKPVADSLTGLREKILKREITPSAASETLIKIYRESSGKG